MIEDMRRQGPTPRVDERDPLERLLGLFEDAGEKSEQPEPRVEVVGGQGDLPTWLFKGDWQVFARAARELTSGSHEIAQFKLPSGEVLSAPLRKAYPCEHGISCFTSSSDLS